MSDQATQRMRIEASVEEIWAVLADFESYPTWAKEVKEVAVLQRDGQDRPVLVRFRTAGFGRSTSYTLSYDWTDAPHRLAWKLVTGDIMRVLDGEYVLTPVDGGTDVGYHLTVDLIVPLPGFVKRRAELRIVSAALRDLRAHVTR